MFGGGQADYLVLPWRGWFVRRFSDFRGERGEGGEHGGEIDTWLYN